MTERLPVSTYSVCIFHQNGTGKQTTNVKNDHLGVAFFALAFCFFACCLILTPSCQSAASMGLTTLLISLSCNTLPGNFQIRWRDYPTFIQLLLCLLFSFSLRELGSFCRHRESKRQTLGYMSHKRHPFHPIKHSHIMQWNCTNQWD